MQIKIHGESVKRERERERESTSVRACTHAYAVSLLTVEGRGGRDKGSKNDEFRVHPLLLRGFIFC